MTQAQAQLNRLLTTGYSTVKGMQQFRTLEALATEQGFEITGEYVGTRVYVALVKNAHVKGGK